MYIASTLASRDISFPHPTEKTFETSCQGLYAGGDVLPREVKQIYLSEHDGMVAAKNIIESLKQ